MKMKVFYTIFTVAVLCLLYPAVSVFSEGHDSEGNPPQEMTHVIQCMATNIALSHLHNQVAASIMTLSAPEGVTTKSMAKGYMDLAKSEEAKIQSYSKVAEEVFIPQILAAGQTMDEIKEVSAGLLGKILVDISKNLANPKFTVEEKSAMEKVLLDKSDQCDKHFSKVLSAHTI